MKTATGILLHAFLGFLYVHQLDADEWMQPNSIYVAMNDGSNFNGTIHRIEPYEGFHPIPDWMQPGEDEFATQVSAFIRLETGEHYQSDLKPMNADEHYNPHPLGPGLCQIRIGDGFVYHTRPISKFTATHIHHIDFPCYPPGNHVYITRRGGPVFSAYLLAPHQLAMTHYRRRLEAATLDVTPDLQTIEPQPSTSQPSQHSARPSHQTVQQARQMSQPPHERGQGSRQPSSKRSRTQQSSHKPPHSH